MTRHALIAFAFIGSFLLASAVSCKTEGTGAPAPDPAAAIEAAAAANAGNPFFQPYGTPFNVPPFDLIKNEHFLPAIEQGIRLEKAEIDAIAANPKKATFANTVAALDHAGIFLSDRKSVV